MESKGEELLEILSSLTNFFLDFGRIAESFVSFTFSVVMEVNHCQLPPEEIIKEDPESFNKEALRDSHQPLESF